MSLLSPASLEIALFTDFFILFSYITMAGFALYVGRSVNYKGKITFPWIIVAIAVLFNMSGVILEVASIITKVNTIPRLGLVLPRPVLWYALNTVGSFALLIAFVLVLMEKQIELSILKKRQLEIKGIMDYLKQRYYRNEISEDELKRLNSELLEHLAETEVKIKEMEKEK